MIECVAKKSPAMMQTFGLPAFCTRPPMVAYLSDADIAKDSLILTISNPNSLAMLTRICLSTFS